jgi:hypothetical protein
MEELSAMTALFFCLVISQLCAISNHSFFFRLITKLENKRFTQYYFSKNTIALLCCNLFFVPILFCQDKKEAEENWMTELGYTQQLVLDSTGHLKKSDLKGFNLRFMSPRFEVKTDDTHWDEEREKNPDKFKKAAFCLEMMYAGKHHDSDLNTVSEFSLSGDFYYALVRYKKFTLDAVAGLKLHFITSPDYGVVNFRKIYFWDCGLSAQLDLGFIVPFIDIRRMGYYTIGTAIRLHPVYQKPRKHYKAHKRLS